MNTLILDLHGVLADSTLMIQNYEFFLINLYSKFNINEENAKKYHNLGLNFFLNSVKKLAKKNLSNDSFINEMKIIDNDWDEMMRKPVKEKNYKSISIIESRYVEEHAGMFRNVLYPDAQKFLEIWKKSYFNDFSLFIASNSHRAHIKGVIKGFNETFVEKINFLGWETLKCFKSHPEYFKKLKKNINTVLKNKSSLIMIGNSSEEIIGSYKSNFFPILIERDRNVSIEAKNTANRVFSSLDGVWEYLVQEFIKSDTEI